MISEKEATEKAIKEFEGLFKDNRSIEEFLDDMDLDRLESDRKHQDLDPLDYDFDPVSYKPHNSEEPVQKWLRNK